MTDLTVSASFTSGVGTPATGLTLSEIDMYLTRQDKATGADTVIWDGTQHPTEEIDNVGAYIRIYNGADLDQYNYYATAHYTGVVALDQVWVNGAIGLTEIVPITNDTPIRFAQPLPYTWLSLQRYAQIIGINPVHFMGGFGQTVWPNASCSKVYPRHTWQSADRVSQEAIAHAIRNAEEEIADLLGFPLAPTWIYDEPAQYPKLWRSDALGRSYIDSKGMIKSIRTKWRKLMGAGRRGMTLIEESLVSYSDADGDGFFETATITVTTTVTDPRELKVYFYDKDGQEEWEIREPRSKTISGGTATLVFDSWLFIHPDMTGAYPTINTTYPVDISSTDAFVSQVEVYREYTDTTQVSSQFFWEPGVSSTGCTSCGGSGCAACGLTSQDGCLFVKDVDLGLVTPQPGTYSDALGYWTADTWTVGREPDQVKVWYRAGDMSRRYMRSVTSDPLKDDYAYAIAYLATARLGRPLCSCATVSALVEELQTDLTRLSPEVSHFSGGVTQDNPFGTRRGEVWAWQRIQVTEPEQRIEVAVF